jgi:hypothetical protein
MIGAKPRACETLRFAGFWAYLEKLPANIQELARENYDLLKANPYHPSLHFKRIGRFWSVRVGRSYRALAVDAKGESYDSGSARTRNMTGSLAEPDVRAVA